MKKINLQALEFIVKENKDKNVVITFHSMGDSDAVSSAISLSGYFSNARVVTPDSITTNAGRILKTLGFNPNAITHDFDENVDMIVMVDVNNFEDCGTFRYKLEEFKKDILIIDHHAPKDIATDNVSAFNDEHYNSACSIVYELLESLGMEVDDKIAMILLSGIISDSADLKNATAKTFIQIGQLLGIAKMDYYEFLDNMSHVSDPISRAKTFEDISKSTVEVIDDMLIVHGKAHSHANIAADYAIKIGADFALFYSENNTELSFSTRLRPPLDKKLGLHLGIMMKGVAKRLGGNGGGHPCAAGAYGPIGTDPKEIEELIISQVLARARGK